ncbi:AAA family ATPase [Bacillus tropicus]|uniref:AAA family ATPase n=1 Tax=Bacillus tropicus TaxID=2026188 RepID=UPI00382B678E
MNPQLLFVYAENLRNCLRNQEFSFTNDFEVTFKSGQLLIHPKFNPLVNLWGEKISNINLIVGKNGAGKSTLLELIGYTKQQRMQLLGNKGGFSSYIMLYHLTENEFILEGTNFDIIKNLEQVPNDVSPEYSILITYDFKKKKAIFKDWIQLGSTSKKSRLNEIAHILYYYNESNYKWTNSKNVFSDDYFVGINRYYLNNTSIPSIYAFLTKESIAKQALNLSNTNRLFIKIRRYSTKELNIYNHFKLYGDHSLSILSKHNEKTLPNIRKKKPLPYSKKEIYILKFLEIFTLQLIENTYESINEDKENLFLTGLEKKLSARLFIESYEKRLNYLITAIEYTGRFSRRNKLSHGISTDIIDGLLRIFKSFPQDSFINSSTIAISLNTEFDKEVSELLYLLQDSLPEFMHGGIDLSFENMSYGEMAFINLFSNIYTSLTMAKLNNRMNTIILILDEPDLAFHPEWTRKFIYFLHKMIDDSKELNKLTGVKFQILISTHSPFMVSDIPKEHINCINIENKNNVTYRIVKKAEFGLMSNFYDIIQNNFFMDSPIGEFAKEVFRDLISRIDKLDDMDKEQQSIEIDAIDNLIHAIDDIIIQKKLTEYLSEKTDKLRG